MTEFIFDTCVHSVNTSGVTVDVSVSAVRVPFGARVVFPVAVRLVFTQAALSTASL